MSALVTNENPDGWACAWCGVRTKHGDVHMCSNPPPVVALVAAPPADPVQAPLKPVDPMERIAVALERLARVAERLTESTANITIQEQDRINIEEPPGWRSFFKKDSA